MSERGGRPRRAAESPAVPDRRPPGAPGTAPDSRPWTHTGPGSGGEAAEYLAATERLLRERRDDADGLWPRASVWMLRLALEAALRGRWHRENPAVALVSMRAQCLALHSLDAVDRAVPGRAYYRWAVLSNACHYHPYDLSPTVAELRSWHDDVADLAQILAAQPRG